ncbi:alpha/beta fold hydrolase [Mycoplasmopsis primatum]|uniref:alpha/beta fold hydrolase n=1 Tax=Mycoplasmopsis primatum TaxID=55604 RepID=UPI00049503D3|nr:alpha/beta hydrolase [Mycoplasmopsis primatum]
MHKTIQINSEIIHYSFEDNPHNKPIFLFVHGFNDKGKTISPVLNLKNRDYVLYTIDLPGCGNSTDNHIPITLEYYGQILSEFIDKIFGKQSINLIAHSMGGVICLMNLHKSNIKQLILVSPFNYYSASNKDIQKAKGWMLAQTPEEIYDSYINLMYEPSEIYKRAIKTMIPKILAEKDKTYQKYNYLVSEQFLNQKYLDDVVKPLYLKANKPITIIYSDEDKYVTNFEITNLLKDNPRFKSYKLNECGHAFFHQKPAEINEIINDSIKK